MNKKVFFILIVIFLVLIITAIKFFYTRISGVSGFRVVSNPVSSVFINEKLIGKTPVEEKYPPGEYILKILPDASSQAYSWQGKVKLNPSVLTYINRELGSSELNSAGEILVLEKIPQDETQISIFSQPDGSIIAIDGQEKGATPVFVKNLSVGDHDVAISSQGFTPRTIRVHLVSGFKLGVNFQLALSQSNPTATPSGSLNLPTLTPVPSSKSNKTMILIKENELGFLRVREGPSKSTKEIGQVKPGDKLPFLEEKDGWFKISFSGDKEGWISASSKYTQKIE